MPLSANQRDSFTGLVILLVYKKEPIVEALEYIYIINNTGLYLQALKHLPNRENNISEGKKGKRCPRVIFDKLCYPFLSLTVSDPG